MSESFPHFIDRRKPKQQLSDLATIKKQRDTYVDFLFKRPRDEREQELKSRFEYVWYMHETNWNSAFAVIDEEEPIYTRDKLLHPDEFAPLLCYPSAPFALDFDIPVVDYYVQPKIMTDRCSDSYDNFRNWLIEQDKGFFEDVDFIKAIPNLAVQFSFYAKTNNSDIATALSGASNGVYVDQEGFVVVPDTRLNFIVSNTSPLDFEDILQVFEDDNNPEYQRTFSNLVLFMIGEEKRALEQQLAISQLHLQHYLCPDLEFVSVNDMLPSDNAPSV